MHFVTHLRDAQNSSFRNHIPYNDITANKYEMIDTDEATFTISKVPGSIPSTVQQSCTQALYILLDLQTAVQPDLRVHMPGARTIDEQLIPEPSKMSLMPCGTQTWNASRRQSW